MTLRTRLSLAFLCCLSLGQATAAERPYLFTADEARLRALIDAGDAKAAGFLSWMDVVAHNRAAFAFTPTWWIAMAAWLHPDATMRQLVHDEVMAEIGANPGGDTGHGDIYLHVHDRMLGLVGSVDLLDDAFSDAERTAIASWVNGTLDNWSVQNLTFWPYDDPLNNYWQNGFLGHVVAGIATRGYNPRADEWLAKAQTMYARFRTACNPPVWNGLVMAEGNGYSNFVDNALWAMDLHDAAQGTTWFADSGIDCDRWLDALRFLTRPEPSQFFHAGSQPGAPWAPVTTVSSTFWHHLIAKAGDTPGARYAKAVLEAGLPGNQPERDRTFAEFYWSTAAVAAVPRSAIPDRMLVAPTPGAGIIGIRSAAGFQPGATAAVMYSGISGGGGDSAGPARFSHAHPDTPGFQWAKGPDWLVTDPDAYTHGGVSAEAFGSAFSNIVTLAGEDGSRDDALFPEVVFAEDNTSGAIPHLYVQIDARPFWTAASTYRRDYVWLGDLQIVAIFDHVVAPQAKSWRMHVPAAVAISGPVASYAVGGNAVTVRDLLASGGGAWAAVDLRDDGTTEGEAWRLSQESTAADYRSLKILDVGGHVTATALVTGAGWCQADLVIDGMARSLRFHDDGSHAEVTGDGADTTPPLIMAVAAAPAAIAAAITWTTNESADAQVDYGLTAAYGASASAAGAPATTHRVDLAGLAEATTYHYRVRSSDAAGNAAVSADAVFTTADATAPVITAANASAGATTVALSAEASDNGGGALAWTWTVASGPAGTVFSGNADQSPGATATLAHAGTYVFAVAVADAAGNRATGTTGDVTVAAVPGSVAILEAAPVVAPGATLALHAAVADQFGEVLSGAGIAWGVSSGGGSVDGSGIYTAPGATGSATVTASCGPLSAAVVVTIRTGGHGGRDDDGGCGFGGIGLLLGAGAFLGLRRRRAR